MNLCFGKQNQFTFFKLIVLGFNDTSTLVGHFVSSPREREKREEIVEDSRGDEREGQGRKRKGMKAKKQKKRTIPLYPYLLQE